MWYCRVIVRRVREVNQGGRERPGPSPLMMTVNLLMSSNEIIYILSRGYIYGIIFSPKFIDSILEPRDL